MSGQNFNPGASSFQPGQQSRPNPNGPPQQQAQDPYGQYQPQQHYYQQYDSQQYPQYQQYQYCQQPQVPFQPRSGTYAPPQIRQVQGFQPPNLPGSAPEPEQRTLGSMSGSKAPVSITLGGARPAPSISIGGPKAAPSISIGGAKPAPSISIGSSKKAGGDAGGSKAGATDVGKKAKEGAANGSVPPASTSSTEDWDEEAATAVPAAPATTKSVQSTPPNSTALGSTSNSTSGSPAAPAAPTDAQTKVVNSSSRSETATPTPSTSTPNTNGNFSRVTAKNDAEAILKEQAAAGEEIMRDLYGDDAADTNHKGHLNIIFTGHVDAGKSTMGGQMLYLTGAVDKRTMEKYEQEAKAAGRETWYLSWALDSGKEERAKGKTVEVGRAYFETDKRRYTILDAPGHKTYVPSMITGAAQADVALLVLSARKGEFETGFERDGQTREHAVLVKNNGINKLILVVNKMDDPTVNWDQARYDEIQMKITPFLKSMGFNPKTDLMFIPISAQIGENMKDKVDASRAPWYKGPSLLGYLDSMQIMDRNNDAPFMLPISEKYNELGTMVMGKIESGRVKKGDSLLLMPNRSNVEVAGIFTEQAEELDQAFSGDNIRLRLRGVSDEDVSPGFVLTSPKNPVKAVTTFRADISIIETKNIIAAGYSCVLHVHTLAEEVTITNLLHYYERRTRRKSKKPPPFAKQGSVVDCLIETSAPICIERFEDYKQLGRFTLRDEGKTVAIGKVTKLSEKSGDMPDVASLAVNGA